MQTYDDVLGAAQGLDPGDRIRLIGALWDSVPPEQWPPPSTEWLAEVQRRSEALDAGKMATSPWPEVRERARKEAGIDE